MGLSLSINPLGTPEALRGLGSMHAESAKTLAKQGFPYNGGWSRHTRMLHECGGELHFLHNGCAGQACGIFYAQVILM